jgi:hypothetical protein
MVNFSFWQKWLLVVGVAITAFELLKERWAWNSLILGVLVWFLLDTSLSLFHKVYFNVALNEVV